MLSFGLYKRGSLALACILVSSLRLDVLLALPLLPLRLLREKTLLTIVRRLDFLESVELASLSLDPLRPLRLDLRDQFPNDLILKTRSDVGAGDDGVIVCADDLEDDLRCCIAEDLEAWLNCDAVSSPTDP
mmetsp:Transcript_12776/g.24778  ORF Transcript_12776/g.24778 Transcript_12776/m.24778 type:complete len:131 (-) Transcript_12776:543-935(-)